MKEPVKTNKPKDDSQVAWGRFMSMLGSTHPSKSKIAIGLLIGLFSTIVSLVIPLLTRNVVDARAAKISAGLVGIVVVAFIIQAATGAFSNYLLGYAGEQVVANLRKSVWDKLLRLHVPFFDEHHVGEIVSRLINDTVVLKTLISDQLPSIINGILTMITSIVILLIMDWRMTMILILGVPVIGLIMWPIGVIIRKLSNRLQKQTAAFNGDATQTFSEIRLVKASNGEATETTRGHHRINDLFDTGVTQTKAVSMIAPVTMLVILGVMVSVLTYGGVRVQSGAMSIGTLIAFLLYMMQVISPVLSLAQFFTALQRARGATARLTEILDEGEEVFDKRDPVDLKNQTLHVNHVDFQYTDDKVTLHDISFEAQPNTVVAFVGPSGGGKSTIFNLIERFYEPTAGTITIGDRNISTTGLSEWRSKIGYVSQDSALLAGTIADNLTYGLDRVVTDDEMWAVLKMAYADEFVADMPDGLQTQVGERGALVSGGQKQRLAIARAFLRDPEILMLDEATASLDVQSEDVVQQAINDLMINRTTLVIAHRLSTIVDADNIIFIEHGEITGQGSHQDLYLTHDLYYDYVHEQFKK